MKSWNYMGLFMWMMCGMAQAQPLQWKDSRFAVDECGIRYNGQPLPLGQDTMEWVRVLGPPDRRLPRQYWSLADKKDIGFMIWDNHGLALKLEQYDDTLWAKTAIFFFLGLESEEGRNLALGTKDEDYAFSYELILNESDTIAKPSPFDLKYRMLKFLGNPRNFPYPIKPICSQVRLDGMLLSPYVKISDLNTARLLQGLPFITYHPANRNHFDTPEFKRDPKAFFRDSTLAGNYWVRGLRICQGQACNWKLRFSQYRRLVQFEVKGYRPWESAILLQQQAEKDADESKKATGRKDGTKLRWK